MLKLLKQVNARITGVLNIFFEIGWVLTFFFDPHVFTDKSSPLHRLVYIDSLNLYIPPVLWGFFLLFLAGLTTFAILQTKYRSQIIHLCLAGTPCLLWCYFALLSFTEYDAPIKWAASCAFLSLTIANIVEILTVRYCAKLIMRAEHD